MSTLDCNRTLYERYVVQGILKGQPRVWMCGTGGMVVDRVCTLSWNNKFKIALFTVEWNGKV